jgi:hypothetical protein
MAAKVVRVKEERKQGRGVDGVKRGVEPKLA